MLGVLKRQRWWIGRIAVLPLHLLAFAIAVFFLVRLIPGDPVYQIMGGQGMTPERIAAARESLGLTGGILNQLWVYLGHVVTLQFGNAMITGSPVLQDLSQRLPETIELAVLAMVGAVVLTLAVAFVVVLHPRNVVSRALLSYARAAGAVPDFVLGVAGVFLFYSVLHWAPAPLGLYAPLLDPPPKITSFPLLDAALSGDLTLLGSMVAHLWLPVLVLVLAHSPLLMKVFIRGLDDAVDAQATRFRIASGASRTAVYVSVVRRAAPSAIAMFGTLFTFMLGGAVLIEQLFGMPGMGQYVVNAVNTSDLVALEGFLLLVAAMSLVVFLVVDIVTMLIDPRRRPGRAEREGS
jgi:ABC-type dipeptide/oligopeptide/nickel transport system permease component